VAAPFVTLLDPELMPGSLLVVACAPTAIMLGREREHADWRGVGWASPAGCPAPSGEYGWSPRCRNGRSGWWSVSWCWSRSR
jgi:hypothetical protein